MKYYLLLLISLLLPAGLSGQGSGLGYTLDVGGSAWTPPSEGYGQYMFSYMHTGFIRSHSKTGNSALQLMLAYKKEYTSFQNTSDFLSADGDQMMSFNTDANIERDAIRVGMIEQYQFGDQPGGLVVFSINTGIFYEYTISGMRYSDYDHISYELSEEMKPNGFGYTLGAELRFLTFTIGYKAEQLFTDVLNHEYILNRRLDVGNSSELRGLMMNPLMHYLYVGVNVDMFGE